jgi:hypothetical protein
VELLADLLLRLLAADQFRQFVEGEIFGFHCGVNLPRRPKLRLRANTGLVESPPRPRLLV